MAAPEVAIELAGVSLHLGRVRVLDRLTLEVPRGIVFGFLGPNGAGKTSTLRVLLGLVRASAGTARVLGLDPATEAPRVRAQVGVLLENDGLYDRLTALANLEYHARIHHMAAPARAPRIEELLRACGLWDRRRDRVATWSKGMCQKLAVASSCVTTATSTSPGRMAAVATTGRAVRQPSTGHWRPWRTAIVPCDAPY